MATRRDALQLASIPTLASLYADSRASSSSHPSSAGFAPVRPGHASPNASFNARISLLQHDITRLSVSAIVNAANSSLAGGGGVDGAIHAAAGPELLRACRSLGGCATGCAKLTPAYALPCEYVIHAVGPVYRSHSPAERERLLAGCYASALAAAREAGCTSVAFAALSTGVYGYPSGEAAFVALREVRRVFEAWEEEGGEAGGKGTGGVERVVFCNFADKDVDAYREWVKTFFPPAEGIGGGG